MFNIISWCFFLALAASSVHMAQATIYVTSPLTSTTCKGGQSCLVQWLDDGEAPLTIDIGPCHVGLYNGQHTLVQQIDPVDVADQQSFTFTPDPNAGPDSNTYYINFTSTNPVGNPPAYYSGFSTFFTLTEMSGSFSSPISSDTSAISVPSSVASAPPNRISTTITIGAPSTEQSSSSFSASPSSVSPSSSPPPASSSGAAGATGTSRASTDPTASSTARPSNQSSQSVAGQPTASVTPTTLIAPFSTASILSATASPSTLVVSNSFVSTIMSTAFASSPTTSSSGSVSGSSRSSAPRTANTWLSPIVLAFALVGFSFSCVL